MDNKDQEMLQQAKAARAKKIGIIILIVVAIPVLLIGTCILLLNNAG
jgi:flagellar basal body-associated protein FliL